MAIRVIRHVLPPIAAVLLACGILLLNKLGLRLLADPLVAMCVLMLAGAVWYLFRPRDSANEGNRRRVGRMSRIIVPAVALLSGPGAAVMLWVLVVLILERDHYISTYERIEQLPPALGVGLFVGIVAFIVAVAWAAWSPNERS